MKLTKKQLKRIIREEKRKVTTEMLDRGHEDVSELLMNLLDAMIKSGVSPYYWNLMHDQMLRLGGEKSLDVIEAAINAYENNEDPNDYA